MPVIPCSVCGYDAPQEPCPHCGGEPAVATLRRRTGPVSGIVDGLLAVPWGLYLLSTTRGVKRWLLPPLIATTTVLIVILFWSFSEVSSLLTSVVPEELSIDTAWPWLEGLSEGWNWLKATYGFLAAGFEWLLGIGWGFLTSQPLRFLMWFFLGSLVMWYCFSIAYEALAGPFLDEIQGRIETKWFGSDPRDRLQRPNDIPPDRCARLTTIGALVGSFLVLLAALLPGISVWIGLLVAPLGLGVGWFLDRRYGPWLLWMFKVEGRATLVSLQASAVTFLFLGFALPLYFVPGVGYFLFSGLCGFATAVSLLDIPFERRGIRLRQRLRFLGRNLLPMVAFGVVSGLLLAVPLVGPVLMVPAASLGGLWLVCRLDKDFLRPPEKRRAPSPPSTSA